MLLGVFGIEGHPPIRPRPVDEMPLVSSVFPAATSTGVIGAPRYLAPSWTAHPRRWTPGGLRSKSGDGVS